MGALRPVVTTRSTFFTQTHITKVAKDGSESTMSSYRTLVRMTCLRRTWEMIAAHIYSFIEECSRLVLEYCNVVLIIIKCSRVRMGEKLRNNESISTTASQRCAGLKLDAVHNTNEGLTRSIHKLRLQRLALFYTSSDDNMSTALGTPIQTQSLHTVSNGGRKQRGHTKNASNAVPGLKQAVTDEATHSAVGQSTEDGAVCWICAEPVKFYSVSQCNHRTCHVCALRLRALYKRMDCTFCKVNIATCISHPSNV